MGAGVHGGRVVAQGTADQIAQCDESLTGQYLSGKRVIQVPPLRTEMTPERVLTITGASGNNLKKVRLEIPVGLLTCVTGVSGSGKSTLINDTLYPIAATRLNNASTLTPAPYEEVHGFEHFDKVVDIDQSPIGRTPRSNPATYTGIFTPIRELFAATPESRARGYTPGRFSFNVKGGRCEACAGDGVIKVEMHFLPDMYVQCDVCKGKRYNRETLEVKYKGKSIDEILNMTVEESLAFFEPVPAIKRKLQTLMDVGLSYITLGQNATTLSGGEAQRTRLATQIGSALVGVTYVLDEPSIGLHQRDNRRLLDTLIVLIGVTILVFFLLVLVLVLVPVLLLCQNLRLPNLEHRLPRTAHLFLAANDCVLARALAFARCALLALHRSASAPSSMDEAVPSALTLLSSSSPRTTPACPGPA